ncbi:SDR family oxidoreductase [Kineosporia succinea]|uniref:3-oxoacyl-[acyl-carrier protein] reductase n=1 Tax=Kineosporia succinea TaxID=84632 RepID=A0ABT9PBU9_9ACTN|nr:SDR family oxidoreductase [Kineosporia succinea]MDP9829490.1 3-oxoacyl-[acyl-carrier protein] reductase [Kineosporia succinea]
MTDRVAIVTGGSGGIGRAVSERLAADGISVLVTFSGGSQRADDVVTAITDAGGRAVAARADVAEPAEVNALLDVAEAEFGGVDVVVNTAGIMRLSPLAQLSLDDLDAMYRVNVRGTFVVSQAAVQRLRSGGALINFSSSVVKLALPTYSAYVAGKAAVDGITRILAQEVRGRDITVNAVAPGPTATPLFLDGKPTEVVEHLAAQAPLERLGEPKDIAEAVSFLAGPARWVNGQVVYVNGGIV